MFELLEKKEIGEIALFDKVRISDPCYDMDTWCAGTLEDVLPGIYHCFSQKVNTGRWGIRVASIEIRHKDYLDTNPKEIQDIDVGVDSGTCGIYDLEYFKNIKNNSEIYKKWYHNLDDVTYTHEKNPEYKSFVNSEFWEENFEELRKNYNLESVYDGTVGFMLKDIRDIMDNNEPIFNHDLSILLKCSESLLKYNQSIISKRMIYCLNAGTVDNKCLVSSSGDGDGSYTCFVGRNKDGKIVSIKINFYNID